VHSNLQAVQVILRVGIAFALLYPAFVAIGDPISWASYFPPFFRALPLELTTILHAFGVLEVVLALWILSGWRIQIPAALTTLLLVAIVGFNLSQMDVLFRDLSIAAMSLALALWPEPHTKTPAS
jgi:hypothetical protein